MIWFFILVAEAVGIIGALFTGPNISGWYATLNKPTFSPPNWLFGPVWLTLYALMGWAAYLVWKKRGGKERKLALTFYWLQLAVNGVWTPIFFGNHQIGVALRIILALWILILVTIFTFRKVNKTAAWLLAPYWLWVTFAAVLNLSLWLLN